MKYEAEHAYMQDEFVSCRVLASEQLGACLDAFQKQSLAILGNDFDSFRSFSSALISAALHMPEQAKASIVSRISSTRVVSDCSLILAGANDDTPTQQVSVQPDLGAVAAQGMTKTDGQLL